MVDIALKREATVKAVNTNIKVHVIRRAFKKYKEDFRKGGSFQKQSPSILNEKTSIHKACFTYFQF